MKSNSQILCSQKKSPAVESQLPTFAKVEKGMRLHYEKTLEYVKIEPF